jgi:hypothetical protein
MFIMFGCHYSLGKEKRFSVSHTECNIHRQEVKTKERAREKKTGQGWQGNILRRKLSESGNMA